jgi:hypothetical protein
MIKHLISDTIAAVENLQREGSSATVGFDEWTTQIWSQAHSC